MFGKNYLISNEAGLEIFESVRQLPVLDAHNHADVASLAKNENFQDLWQLFAATDHYVWEVMRKAGVPEEFITGPESNHDKFMKLAQVFEDIAGNPVYEWIHLDLRFLGISDLLNADSGEAIWKKGLDVLAAPESRPLELLKRLNVKIMCSTDDPADSLENHRVINEKLGGAVVVKPTWRPDKAMKIGAVGFAAYIEKLGKRFGTSIKTLSQLMEVMQQSHDYFESFGCVASDHGLELAPSGCGDVTQADAALQKVLAGQSLTQAEIDNYMNVTLGEFAEMNAKSNWVTQLHIGAVRDVRKSLFETMGPDVGGDVCSLVQDYLPNLVALLNRFDNRLKIVLYSLDPAQYPTLATLARAFGRNVRLGSAWWLLDTPIGMKRQLEYIGSVDLFTAFAGMVSDSRKLLSYGSRFEMFRRVLSDVLGNMVKMEQIPLPVAKKIARTMCYDGPADFFFGK